MAGKKKGQPKVTKSKAQAQVSLGGPNRSGGAISEDFLAELRYPQAAVTYNEMRKNSPVIGGFLRAIESAFRSTTWKSVPYDNSSVGYARAGFLQETIEDTNRPWSDIMSDILTFLPFGFSFNEMVFKLREGSDGHPTSKFRDGKVGFKDFVLIPHDSIIEWLYDEPDEPDELIGVRQLIMHGGFGDGRGGTADVPLNKSLLFRTRAEKNSPEGESVLRQAYRSWYYMSNLEAVEAISLERTGAGIPVLHLPPGATTKAEAGNLSDIEVAKQIVRQVRVDEQGGIVEPDGWTFRLEMSKGLRPELFDLAIKRHRANILMSVLAVFLELGTARVGSFATAKSGRSYFENSLEGYVNTVEDVFNLCAVPLLFELNGITDGQLPKLTHTTFAGEGMVETIESILKLLEAGLIDTDKAVLSEYMSDILHLPRGATITEQRIHEPHSEGHDKEEKETEEPEDEPEEVTPAISTNGATVAG